MIQACPANNLILGQSAEYMVMAELAKEGIPAILTNHLFPYDCVIDVEGALYKVQVKSCYSPRTEGNASDPAYIFRMRRGFGRRVVYNPDQADIFAFVSISTGEIAYKLSREANGSSARFLLNHVPRRYRNSQYLSDFPLSRLIKILKEKNESKK